MLLKRYELKWLKWNNEKSKYIIYEFQNIEF